ncbi:MAG: LysM peptidoglycan-binding domain-containing protein [Anaerolineaceae bacterium]|nr:LysM peptidoglycan-binding domain-containing protein [Anaerolineaceae bacterium]
MPRDIGNEIVVAIAAIGILAFAFVFAIVLSLSNISDADQTATASAVVQPTRTEVVLVASPSATEQPPSTTPLPPSATPLPIVSQQSATPRPVSPTALLTAKPSVTRIPTQTPSHTATATNTATTTATQTPSATPTILSVTESLGILPTPTAVTSQIAVVSPDHCTPPSGWVVYVVQVGDTLFSIAQASGSSVNRLQTANCLDNINSIFAGTLLYVPRQPQGHPFIQPPYSGTRPTGTLAVEGCTYEGARITNLSAGQTVSGLITLVGSATVNDFWYYKIEIRPNYADVYNFYSRSETSVTAGTLGVLDTRRFDPEVYWVRLTVLANSSEVIPTCTIPVIINNP